MAKRKRAPRRTLPIGPQAVDRITIEGFKSIRSLQDFKLGAINVLIGANGSGKSNFVQFFRLMGEMMRGRLQYAVGKADGPDALMHLGRKVTRQIRGRIYFGSNGYEFTLESTGGNRMIFAEEVVYHYFHKDNRYSLGSGHSESSLSDEAKSIDPRSKAAAYVYEALSSWTAYHFHDTSATAPVKGRHGINDNERLRPEAENLASLLYRLRNMESPAYGLIRDTVRLAAPFFDDFVLRPVSESPDQIQLEWRQRDSDYPFLANQLSDGTLRFICIAAALLQPDPPVTLLLDEPELGLHPYALNLLGALCMKAAARTQVILCTQSPLLLNSFEPSDVVVLDRVAGASTFHRLDPEPLAAWLKDYSLSQLWQKNLLGGAVHGDRSGRPPFQVGGHSGGLDQGPLGGEQ